MSTQPEMVEVNLDRERSYRDPADPSQVKRVGPGKVTIPKVIAAEWGIQPGAQGAPATGPQGKLPEGAVSGTIETVEEIPAPEEDDDAEVQ